MGRKRHRTGDAGTASHQARTLESGMAGRLTGKVDLVFFGKDGRRVREYRNSVTTASSDVIRSLLARQFEDKMISRIAMGDGGDLEILPPHNDTGQRVAPDPGETGIRSLVEALPILIVSQDVDDIRYTALAKPEQAISNEINEFALLTRDGTMVAHFVTEEVTPGGRARDYPKTSWEYLAIRWKLTYTSV